MLQKHHHRIQLQLNMELNMWDFSLSRKETRQPVTGDEALCTKEEHCWSNRTDQCVVLPPHLLLIQGMTTS